MSKAAAVSHTHRDDEGSRIGMWLFLFTELILFGGMFIVYAVYRFKHFDEFRIAGAELDVFVGTLNTVILLTSRKKILSMSLLSATIVLAFFFLVNKYFEWSHKIAHGIYPKSPELMKKPAGEILYFGLYYMMTGLHALHVIIGMIILGFMLVFIARNVINQDSFVKLEAGGLYWHLVDIIWIFLFPLFYLIH